MSDLLPNGLPPEEDARLRQELEDLGPRIADLQRQVDEAVSNENAEEDIGQRSYLRAAARELEMDLANASSRYGIIRKILAGPDPEPKTSSEDTPQESKPVRINPETLPPPGGEEYEL